jgi:hypothetical protein
MLLPSFMRRWMNGKAFAPRRARPATTRSARRRAWLRLEALEDRSVPSTVTNLFDSGGGSLRQAILDTPAGGTVDFQAGLSGTITLMTGELAIGKNLTIAGPGASVLTVSGNHASRVFDIAPATVVMSGLTIANGGASNGGGIFNNGTLTITDSIIRDNNAPSGGGGVFNNATLVVTDSVISGNTAMSSGVGGGGIFSQGAMVTVTRSTIRNNTAIEAGGIAGSSMTILDSTIRENTVTNFFGGGVSIRGSGNMIANSTITGNRVLGAGAGGGIASVFATATITNSTISNNTANSGGGIFNDDSHLTVMSTTVVENTASLAGGGINNDGATGIPTVVRNTLIAGNTAPASPDVYGTLDSQGHNLIGDGTGGSGYDPSDLVGTSANPIDPKLGPLQDNGGPTFTMALLPGSPAIGAGDPTDAPPWDQRGPGFPRIVNGRIDIGAFEVQAVALTVQCSVTTSVLWPPNHQLVNVGLSVQVSDPNATVTMQVFANDGARSADAADLAPGKLRLRGERQGGGRGRVYLIVVQATDAAGDVAVGVCTVVVPHDQSADALAAVDQQAADAAAYFQTFVTAPPGYALLG